MLESLIFILEKIGIPEWMTQLVWPVLPFIGVLTVGMFFGVVFLVLMERRVLALLTVRCGPNRVGYDGVFQTMADGLKIMFKEDIMSSNTHKILFTIAPCLAIISSLLVYAVIPFTEHLTASSLAVGLIFFLAVSSIHTVALLLAGLASNNKYSLLGGFRSVAQSISYEIPLIIAAISVIVIAGTLNLNGIIADQKVMSTAGENIFQLVNNMFSGVGLGFITTAIKPVLQNILSWNIWYYNCFACLIGFGVFFICSIAEVNRIPFDLPEAESELVSGFSTEYSGIKFAMFFMAEYVSLLAIVALTVVLFFGGYLPVFNDYIVNIFFGLFPNIAALPIFNEDVVSMLIHLEQAAWFVFKVWLMIFILMLIRATLPRLRADQMMDFCWKFLLPVSLINLLLITVFKYIGR